MVGLGNSCRGMKSPPLLMAALVSCLIVLGFNYWAASSRSVDLQGRVMDLEGKVRRAAAERGAVEQKKNEFQGELEKQRQQIDKIQSLHSLQMENANRVHQEEKAMLMNNITVNDRLIQSLREHLKALQTEYGKLQQDVYWFQKNQTNLQKKFSYDLSQCISQMKELKEQCEERIDELRKKSRDVPQIKENKDFTGDSQVDTQLPALKQTGFKQADLEQQKTNEDVPKAVPTIRKTDLMQAKERTDSPTDMRKQDPEAEEEQLSSQLEKPQESLKAATGHKEMLPVSEKDPNPPEDEKHVAGQDMSEPAAEQAASEEVEREQFLNYDDKQDDLLPGKADKQDREAVNQDKDVDYNSDVNEAESETDKQAALAGSENVQNHEDTKNHLPDNGEGRQK
ncbi:Golgi membrane protein 1 [Passer montanus]|uniref:Golgi membrane protein 1 n=1 Tax=Passer montanus TaxID=9160 RepID=UPI0019620F52|nr:Golgi membrane protein 1 [Passer montanus]XP_039585504.1 Golgi membrane protein 1 [Passer montanus]XP_039585505.1 Golgi membrane protein 1 [Passer montanus]XP_039585506.1 Golgi membrane protein 1 [Passer montanus]XP_039585507.1 Golgi membrane protein 1 [Passer montanus]XP_039585508.1 Golgi membrane protein 1 [Passer montanus]XP_039585510.1 Golgi membrane protein 1 [Passer montanus]XP_039585511.1 Golgi membrane protein 1 [Passer montanus]XP_039585512.1 Golgi membrane protein 1 [Passer mon